MMYRPVREGFSLMEVMIAVMIIGLLTVAVGIPFMNMYKKSQVTTTRDRLRGVQQAVNAYHLELHVYPDSLRDLIRKPLNSEVAGRWDGPYLQVSDGELPEDAWDKALVYKKLKPGSQPPYELYSWGPNGEGSPASEWVNVWKK